MISFTLFLLFSIFNYHIQKIVSNEKELIFDIDCEFKIDTVEYLHNKYLFIGSPSCPFPSGYPSIPQINLKFILPPEGDFKVNIEVVKKNKLSPSYPLLPIPKFKDDGLSPIYKLSEDKSKIYGSKVIHLKKTGYFKSSKYGEIVVNLVSYKPGEYLILRKKIRVFVRFIHVGKAYRKPSKISFESSYKMLFINSEMVKKWLYERKFKSEVKSHNKSIFFEVPFWVKIKVSKEGVYRITKSDLQDIGIPIQYIDFSKIKLFTYGYRDLPYTIAGWQDTMKEVPVMVIKDTIYFYAFPKRVWEWSEGVDAFLYKSPYTDTNIYWLGLGFSTSYKRITDKNASPENYSQRDWSFYFYHYEKDEFCPAKKGILWLGDDFSTSTTKTFSLKFNLSNLFSSSGKVKVRIANLTEDVFTQVKVECGDSSLLFNISSVSKADIEFNTTGLKNGDNYIKFTIYPQGGKLNQVYLDYYEVITKIKNFVISSQNIFYFESTGASYDVVFYKNYDFDNIWLVCSPFEIYNLVNYEINSSKIILNFDLNKPQRVVIFERRNAFRPLLERKIFNRNLRDIKEENPDMLVISPYKFSSVLQKYISYRSSHFLVDTGGGFAISSGKIVYVSLEDIIEQFGYGIKCPQSIRNFVRYIYGDDAESNLKYVFLVGKGSYDYRNIYGNDDNLIPVYYDTTKWEWVDINAGGGAWDGYYGDMDGDGRYEEVIVGRFPALNIYEISSYIEKIKIFENQGGFWRTKSIFLADDERGTSTGEFAHTQQADEILRFHVPDFMDKRIVYLIEYPYSAGHKPLAEKDIINLWSSGFYTFIGIGHGSPYQFAHEDVMHVPRTFDEISKNVLSGFLMFISCKMGVFDRTGERGIAEYAVVNGFNIISSASTDLYIIGANQFPINVFEKFKEFDKLPIGLAIEYSKGVSPYDYMYAVLGDPSLIFGYGVVKDTIIVGDTLYIKNPFTFKLKGEDENYIICIEPGHSRVYYSPYGGSVEYYSPGKPVYRISKILKGSQTFHAFVPLNADTGLDGKVIALEKIFVRKVKDSIRFAYGILSYYDTLPPTVRYYSNGFELKDSSEVYKEFTLEMEFFDSSGINLKKSDIYGLRVFIDNFDNWLDMGDLFYYIDTMGQKGKLFLPLEFDKGGYHSVFVRVSDNVGNIKIDTLVLDVKEEIEEVEWILPYPSPAKNKVGFFFKLNVPAYVEIKVFTIGGRLLWSSGVRYFASGMNSINYNVSNLSNGVYIFKATFKMGDKKVEKIGKFIVNKRRGRRYG